MSLPSIADRVRTASTVAVLRELAFGLLDRIQHADPADQVRAQFLTLAVYADVLKLDIFEEVARAQRMMASAEADYAHHIQAIRDFCESEVLRRPR